MIAFLTETRERLVFALALVLLPCTLTAAFIIDGGMIGVAAISAGFLIIGISMPKVDESLSAVGASVALIGQAIALTAAFQGHSWQIDSHMLFFALLACLVSLRNVAALLVGSTIIALHHLSLSFLMPAMIYPSGGFVENLERTVFHAAIVIVETAALLWTVHQLNALNAQTEEQTEALQLSLTEEREERHKAQKQTELAENAKKEADDSRLEAESALVQVQQASKAQREAEAEQKALNEEQRRIEALRSSEQSQVVSALRAALARLEGGDLTTQIEHALPEDYDEIRTLFNSAVQSLDNVVTEVAQHTEAMEADIREISAATDNLARRTEVQAANLNRASESLSEITQSVALNASNVESANKSSRDARSNAKDSGHVVSEASDAMTAIQAEAEGIANIVSIIEGISFQTNLLALNAGVEAARAGESGRGFTVVASEVRALAQRSSESATSIRELIERSTMQVETGSVKISDTVSALGTVEAAIEDISAKMATISDGTAQQSKGISSINASVAEIGAVIQENAAMFEETNAACSNLSQGAEILRGLTLKFRLSTQKQAVRDVA